MSFNIISLESFEKDVKRLAKKYNKIGSDLRDLGNTLTDNPKAGIALSNNLYKLRVKNSSTKSGKSGGFSIIYYYIDEQDNIYLMKIYSKTEIESISEEKLLEILKASDI